MFLFICLCAITMSTIQNFYKNQAIFLTGATGFLGKLILEKLLRSCPDVKKIYVLIRPKKNKTQIERFQALVDQPCFLEMKKVNPNFLEKIQIIDGDLTLPNLGLNQNCDLSQVTCIIHSAAIVKFDKDLRTAVNTNVRPVRDLLLMAEKMPKLVSFVYVSTAFSHCIRETIKEEFYDVGVDPNNIISLVEGLDDKILNMLTPSLLGRWPNTYVYSKALAEEIIRQNKNLPIAIVRPAIVASTNHEPVPGWIDNFQGLAGVVVGVSIGVLRTLHVDPQKKAHIVPADHVVNNILASAWHVKTDKKIYNCTGSDSDSNTWGEVVTGLMNFSLKYPLNRAVWYYSFSLTPSKLVHKLKVFFFHTLFAWVIDLIFFLVGKPQIAAKKYRKINKLIDSLSYFTLKSWNFGTTNSVKLWEDLDEQDKNIFNFNMKNFDWKNYFENCVMGGRIYLMKDPLTTIPEARRRILFLGFIHYALIIVFSYLIYTILFYFMY